MKLLKPIHTIVAMHKYCSMNTLTLNVIWKIQKKRSSETKFPQANLHWTLQCRICIMIQCHIKYFIFFALRSHLSGFVLFKRSSVFCLGVALHTATFNHRYSLRHETYYFWTASGKSEHVCPFLIKSCFCCPLPPTGDPYLVWSLWSVCVSACLELQFVFIGIHIFGRLRWFTMHASGPWVTLGR